MKGKIMPEEDQTEDLNPETPAEGYAEASAPDDDLPIEPPEPSEPSEPSDAEEAPDTEEEPDTFPREYVEKLRSEAAESRVKAKRADDLAQRLHTALTAATGRLADPTDLPYDDAHLEDPEKLTAAIEDLLQRKPHLASRRVSGGVGQGVASTSNDVDLAGLLRARA